jgi:error-prone DNA polymerase
LFTRSFAGDDTEVPETAFAVRLGLRMVKGLSKDDAETIVAARADRPFATVGDLWRRAAVPAAALVRLAEADAFRPSMKLARREALWAIRALRDEPLPLFEAASVLERRGGGPRGRGARERRRLAAVGAAQSTTRRGCRTAHGGKTPPLQEGAPSANPETNEPQVELKPMTAGGEVVKDYSHVGLTLRSHPVAFLRDDLRRRRVVTCAEAMASRDGQWLTAAGLVLVRQMPGSAKGVMFITIEDETGIANLVVWPKVFEKQRRAILGSGMLAVHGRIQRVEDVVHLVAHRLTDLSADLAGVGDRDFPLPHGRGDELHHGSPGVDPRSLPKARDIGNAYGHIDRIRVKARDFR